MSAMDLQQEREGYVYIAKLAEEAKRYDDMADAMKKVAKLDVELTVEERNLLSVGYKNVLLARTACCRILSSIEQKEESRGNEQHVCKTREYRQKVESELSNIFNDLMAVIDGHLIPSSPATEASVFYYKMKGDCYSYLVECMAMTRKRPQSSRTMRTRLLQLLLSLIFLQHIRFDWVWR